MNNELYVDEIIKNGNRITVNYRTNGEWKKFFNNNFFVEYEFSVTDIPDSIAVIPFVANVLPIAWIMNARVYVSELDDDFYHCIDLVKKGYINMMPQFRLQWSDYTGKKNKE